MNLEDLVPEVLTDAPGVLESVALIHLRYATRELCERSKVWQEDLDSISIVSGFPAYDIDTPAYTEIVTLYPPRYDSQEMSIYTPAEMDRVLPDWRTDTGTGVSYIVQDWTTLYVVPVPSADDANTISLRAALKPTMEATTVSDILGNWREGLVAGALARLKTMPGKQWTDREGAAHYKAIFERAIANAQHKALGGFAVRSTSIIPRAFV